MLSVIYAECHVKDLLAEYCYAKCLGAFIDTSHRQPAQLQLPPPTLPFKVIICGLYYKPLMIVNDNSRVINRLEASLTDDARVLIYDRQSSHVYSTSHWTSRLNAKLTKCFSSKKMF
jgi:hypothetical protein